MYYWKQAINDGPKSGIHSNSNHIKMCTEYVQLHLSWLDVIQNLQFVFAIAIIPNVVLLHVFWPFFIRSFHLLVNFYWYLLLLFLFIYPIITQITNAYEWETFEYSIRNYHSSLVKIFRKNVHELRCTILFIKPFYIR